MAQIQITQKQKENYNKMLNALKTITKYQSPEKLRKDSKKDWGLDFEEAIEYAYDNIQGEAKIASKGIRPIT
jgi:hypothetical protein